MLENAKKGVLDALRAQIQALELDSTPNSSPHAVVPLGATEIDSVLPWSGLPRTGVHEIEGKHGAALGFAVALLARFVADRGPALWCFRQTDPYAPGLRLFGLDPNFLIAVRAHRAHHVLWVLEEALRAHCLGAVLGEVATVGLTASRRLQLAARTGNTPCLLLCHNANAGSTTAITRWRSLPVSTNENDGIGSANFLGESRWRIELVRCRGAPGSHHWIVKWCHETHCLRVVTPLADRSGTSAITVLRNAV